MSTLTTEQALERLAVLARDMVKIEPESGIVYVFRREAWRKATKVGTLDPDLLFGAACEFIERQGWGYILEHPPTYSGFRMFENQEQYSKDVAFAYAIGSDDCNAVLNALVLALEGRLEDCPECEGKGWIPDYTGTYGRLAAHPEQEDCPACQGSGKKSEEVAG